MEVKGTFYLKHVRNGATINEYKIPNNSTQEGLTKIFDTYFRGIGDPPEKFYLGLISDTNFEDTQFTDTMSSHPKWEEFVNYSGNRKEWVHGDRVNGTVDTRISNNDDRAIFVISGSDDTTIRGLFLTTDPTKGGTSGLLQTTFDSGVFSSVSVIPGDQLELIYILGIDMGVFEGSDNVVDFYFKGESRPTSFFLGLKNVIQNPPNFNDTLLNHPSWSEVIDYVGDRKSIVFGAPTFKPDLDSQGSLTAGGQLISALTTSLFDFTDDSVVGEAFIATVASGSNGLLIHVVEGTVTTPLNLQEKLTMNINFILGT